jgi:hypothetical protein
MNEDPIDLPSFASPTAGQEQFPVIGGRSSEKKTAKETRRFRRPVIPAASALATEPEVPPQPPVELLELLSRLEQGRAQLERSAGRPAQALLTIAGMIEETAEAARRCQGPAETEGPAFVEAERYCAEARKLQKELAGSALRKLLSFASGARAARQERPQQLLAQAAKVLEGLFSVLGGHCASPPAAKEWELTYTLFLSELKPIMAVLVS